MEREGERHTLKALWAGKGDGKSFSRGDGARLRD